MLSRGGFIKVTGIAAGAIVLANAIDLSIDIGTAYLLDSLVLEWEDVTGGSTPTATQIVIPTATNTPTQRPRHTPKPTKTPRGGGQ